MSDETQALLWFLAAWAVLAAAASWVLYQLVRGAGDDPDEPQQPQTVVDLRPLSLDDEVADIVRRGRHGAAS